MPAARAFLCILLVPALLGCPRPAEELESTPPISSTTDARERALAWIETMSARWRELAPEDRDGKLALWAEVADAIANQADPEQRLWMRTGQFLIGSDPHDGLDRPELAEALIAELGFEDPHWAIAPYALATAAYETGRWNQLSPELDARIATAQPEVAAYLALERYMETTNEGEWARAEWIWSQWLARPELAATQIGPIMASMGPQRRLAPGNFVPDFCFEALEGGRLCTRDLEGLTLIDLWAKGCEGCVASIPGLRDVRAKLIEAYPDDPPRFISVDIYDEPEVIREFLRETPMPWPQAWIPESERDAFEAAFETKSIPVILLVGPDGRILASSPSLTLERIEARVEHFSSLTKRAAKAVDE